MSDEKPQWPKKPSILIRVPQRKHDSDASADAPARAAAAAPFYIKPGVRRRERQKTEIYPVPAVIAQPRKTSRARKPTDAGSRLLSRMSIRRVNDRNGNRGFPTMFRPQVGAVGGNIELQPKTNIFALFGAALLTLFAANSAPMDKLVQALQSEGTTAQASTAVTRDHASPSIFVPLFGPQAVETCSIRCRSLDSNSDGAACRSACQKLSLSEYARRIRLMDTTPKGDGDLIVESCSIPPTMDSHEASIADWEVGAKTAFQLLRDLAETPQSGNFARARLSYSNLSRTFAELKYPPPNPNNEKQRQLTDRMLRASCLWAHTTLIDLALVLVRQSNDDFSLRYYSELKQFVQRPLTQMEPALLKDGKVLLTHRNS